MLTDPFHRNGISPNGEIRKKGKTIRDGSITDHFTNVSNLEERHSFKSSELNRLIDTKFRSPDQLTIVQA